MDKRFRKVFISYTFRDSEVSLEKLQSLKRQMPLSSDSFVDAIDNDSEEKQARVDQELQECDSLLQVKSPSVLDSPWAFYEISKAWSRNIPVDFIDPESIELGKDLVRHKVFISYHHANDQWAKDRLIELNKQYDIFIDCSVDTGDIPDTWDDQHIRTEIRDNYLRDSTVTILLVGVETRNRKHIDWELYSSMFDGQVNKKSGIVVIMLPSTGCTYRHASHTGEKEYVFPKITHWENLKTRTDFERCYPCMPNRIIDNLLSDTARISVANWDDLNVSQLSVLIDNAAKDRSVNIYDMSRPMKRRNSYKLES